MKYTTTVTLVLVLVAATAGCIGAEEPGTDSRTQSTKAPVVSVAEEPGKLTFNLIPGDINAARLEGPNGTSIEMDINEELLILTVEIKDGGFSEEEISGDLVTPNTDECRILRNPNYDVGQTVDRVDIPCDGSGIDDLEGDDLRYEDDGGYQFVSVADGEKEVIQDVVTTSAEQESGKSVKFSIDIKGDLIDVVLVSPSGNTSVYMNDSFATELTIEVQGGGFSEDEIEGELVTPNDDECRILHEKDEIAGQTVSGADIPCDGSGIDGLSGKEIRWYEVGLYQVVGVVRGDEWVIHSVEIVNSTRGSG